MKKRIIISDISQEMKDFLELPPSIEKNITYRNVLNSALSRSILIDGNDIYYSEIMKCIRRGGHSYYLANESSSGFSYKDKKLRIWYGKTISALTLLPVLHTLGHDWFIKALYPMLNKTTLKGILSGKITNPRLLTKSYLKSIRLDISPKVYLDCVLNIEAYPGISWLNSKLHCSLYPEHLLKRDDIFLNTFLISDLCDQAVLLNRKINFKWSVKRLNALHIEWTKEIMNIEVKSLPDYEIDYSRMYLPQTPKEFTLLRTQKEVFMEGSSMNHCIYTNYWNRIKNKEYLAYHISKNGEEATLGLSNSEFGFKIDQIKCKANMSVSKELVEYVQISLKPYIINTDFNNFII